MEQLAPPPGTALDAAVATTFTLDLTATLLPALAFTGFDVAGGLGDPIATLESLRSTAGKVDVFCQAGAIFVPDQSPSLLAFLEPIIHPVKAPTGGLFHPKFWFVRYVDETGAPTYRLLVLTRNLTLDSSWDLAVRLDSSRVERGAQPQSTALGELIASLPRRTLRDLDEDRRDRLVALAREARRIVWELPNGIDEVLLHYLDRGRQPSFSFRGSRHLIVSPFLDRSGIETVRDAGEVQVLSRAEELDKLNAETIQRLNARVLDDLAVVQQVQGSRLGGQLHAKMYVVEQVTNWSKSHVLIGSANATGAAFSVNTEFMVELRGHKRSLGIDQFLGEKGDFLSVTEPYLANAEAQEDPADEAQRILDNALRRVAAIEHTVDVVRADEDATTHAAEIRTEKPYSVDNSWHVTIELLTLPDHPIPLDTARALDIRIEPLATAEITPFLAIRIRTPEGLQASTVIIADLRHAPADRLDVILATQIDTPEKFLRFLFFLLSLGDPAGLAGLASSQSQEGAGSPFGQGASGVLEMVLRAIATRPSAIADLDALVARLESTEQGLNSLPEGFQDFWHVVRDAVAIAGGVKR